MGAKKKTSQKAAKRGSKASKAKPAPKAASAKRPAPKKRSTPADRATDVPGQRKLLDVWSPQALGGELRPERFGRKRTSSAFADAAEIIAGARGRKHAKKDDDVEFVSEAVEVIDVADDSDSDVVAYPETPVKREVATPVKKEVADAAAAAVSLPPLSLAPVSSPAVKHNLKKMSAAEIEEAWRGEGLAHPKMQFLCREVAFEETDLRLQVKEVVHRAICARQEQYEKYDDDYRDVFCRSKEYRILAAFVDGQLCGGLAFKTVPKGVYLEFLGTKINSHVGKPMVKQLKTWVKVHPDYYYIALNSLDPVAMKRESKHAMHTLSFWSERGFQPLEQATLARLTYNIEPERGASRPYRVREFYKLFDVPEASTGTSAMIWIPTKPREDED